MSFPRFSVIVPTRARPAQIRACCASLRNQEYPSECFEIIVVDDGGPTDLRPLLEPLNVTLVRQPRGGPARARNAGAARATGEYLAFTDDDCLPDIGWLAALAEASRAHPGAALGGRTVNALPENPYSAASQFLVDYLYEQFARYPESAFWTSNNLAIPGAAFRDLGGFDERFPWAAAEDRDLCRRWLAQGRVLAFAPRAVVHHAHALTLRTFCRQHFNYGRGAAVLHRLAKRPPALRPWEFYAGLLVRPPRMAGLLALSQLATAAGYSWQQRRRPPDSRD